ncbi:DUF3305 domain-containing protein [Caldovatus aquaticus]|uniref:DUF3305 domain-containing protein n=1 Tax=Caldovatus aquaticus TaxID=2865671 RepID=A0ABS7F9F5_9PROT|nr:DUF3305 domain-containing protein [Caldovatus aquaticus]MBW8271435.1 DUF3305 domain-containing protein [Caldovatus aquaticus]
MMRDPPGTVRIPVAVLAERRRGATPWQDWVWRAVEVLEEAPPGLAPWTVLRRRDDGGALYFAGHAEVALHPTDTPNYRANLAADPPRVWVVLRPVEAEPGMALHTVTVDAGEAHLYADAGNDLLESLPMPPGLRAVTEAFVARHHVERAVPKRRRHRADPEALAAGRPRGGGATPQEDEEGPAR